MKLLFIGLGRIGLPQALVFANSGHEVFGYDIADDLLEQLRAGRAPFHEPHLEEYLRNNLDLRFHPTDDWKPHVGDADAIFFTLGTKAPDSESCLKDQSLNVPSIKHLLSQIFAVDTQRSSPVALIFRTTLPIGTIDALREFLESSLKLIHRKDFLITFVPERLVEGNAIREEESLPKIVGAYCDEAYDLVAQIFAPVGGALIRVSSPRAAEFCKLTDNSYRNTTFAFANEVAVTASALGLDAMEILGAVNTDYERNQIPSPGFVSGYCLGKDPYIFEYAFNPAFNDRGFQSLWYYGRRTNDFLIDFTVEQVVGALGRLGKSVGDAHITLLGLSFKDDVDDFRMSHAFQIIEGLINHGCFRFRLYDPYLEQNRYTQLPDSIDDFIEVRDNNLENPQLFKDTDVVIVGHRHQAIRRANDPAWLTRMRDLACLPLYVFDGWNVWREADGLDGIVYESLGYGMHRSDRRIKSRIASEVGIK
jgi:nucleotide sugar dehydrogenase